MKTALTCLTLLFALAPLHISRADDSPLAEQMDLMNDAYKAMGKESDAAKGAALAREAQTAMIKSLEFTPEAFDTLFPDKKEAEKAMADYRRMMGETYVIFCKIEIAFLEGKSDEVKKLLADAKAMKKEGHNKFMEE